MDVLSRRRSAPPSHDLEEGLAAEMETRQAKAKTDVAAMKERLEKCAQESQPPDKMNTMLSLMVAAMTDVDKGLKDEQFSVDIRSQKYVYREIAMGEAILTTNMLLHEIRTGVTNRSMSRDDILARIKEIIG